MVGFILIVIGVLGLLTLWILEKAREAELIDQGKSPTFDYPLCQCGHTRTEHHSDGFTNTQLCTICPLCDYYEPESK